MPEPIDIVPGVYTTQGKKDVTGLCVMIDDQDDKWEVSSNDNYTTTIKIKKGSKWKVQEYKDPKTGKRKVQIFREGAKLNSLVLKQFINPTEGVYTPNGNAESNETPELRIVFTTPDDGDTPPINIYP